MFVVELGYTSFTEPSLNSSRWVLNVILQVYQYVGGGDVIEGTGNKSVEWTHWELELTSLTTSWTEKLLVPILG